MWDLSSDPIHRVDDIVAEFIKRTSFKGVPESVHLLLRHYFSILSANVIISGYYDCL